jgi:hypothetical protein
VLDTSTKKIPDSERLSNFHDSVSVKEGLEVGNRVEYAMKSLLQMSGYSDKATHEIMKWYKPKRGKAMKKWRDRAWLVDFKKTTVSIVGAKKSEYEMASEGN